MATGRARGEDPHAVTVADALAALNRLCLPVYDVDVTHKSGTDKDAQQEKKDKPLSCGCQNPASISGAFSTPSGFLILLTFTFKNPRSNSGNRKEII